MPASTVHISPARASVALFGGADGVYIRVGNLQSGPVSAGATDAATAEAVAATISVDMAGVVAASASGPLVLLEAMVPGASGNDLSLDAEATTTGSALATNFSGGVSAIFTF